MITATERTRQWRADNPERAREQNRILYARHKDAIKARSKSAYHEKRDHLQTVKLERGCAECGYADNSAALQFHHRDPATKTAPVTTIAANSSWAAMEAEVEKCDVLCANCHAIHHYAY